MIDGVKIKELLVHSDERGDFREILRASEGFMHDIKQISLGKTKPGNIKAFHWHKHQDDIFYAIAGKLMMVLHDGRADSKTKGDTQVVLMGEEYKSKIVFIPRGVLHGYKVLGDKIAEVLYMMNNEYNVDAPDEERLPHDDHDINFNWDSKEKYRELKECRICSSDKLIKYLDLGDTPLANSYVSHDGTKDEEYPLKVLFCENCGLSMLDIVVDPEVLYKNYSYRSSISNFFRNHCKELSDDLVNTNSLKYGELVVDIASNDGTLLEHFSEKNKVLGIEPATNLARIANNNGIRTIDKFWEEKLAEKILMENGPAKIITAFNVFGHVHDVHSFVKAARILLDKNGYLIIEVPHLMQLIGKNEFDTIYHEHLSYFLIGPLIKLMEMHRMRIAKVREFEMHGGSIRFYVEHKECIDRSDGSVEKLIEKEKEAGLYRIESYFDFSRKVNQIKEDLLRKIHDLRAQGKSVVGFGASAKGNTLLNYAKIDRKLLNYIFDATPEKQNKFTPGMHIPVVHSDLLMEKKPDYLLLLAWNFADEIMLKTQDFKKTGGKYIVPIPNLKVFE